jgi:hypothetical protein
MKIPRATPDAVFALVEVVQRLQPCTIEQVRAELRAQWPPVRSAASFARHFDLVSVAGRRITSTDLCTRMLRYTGTKRIDFLIAHARIQEKEPFSYLAQTLRNTPGLVEKQRIGELLRNRFDPGSRWTKEELATVSECYSKWMEFLRLTKEGSAGILWVGGGVTLFDVTALAELDFLQDRSLYDHLVETYPTSKNMLDEPHELLVSVANEKDDEARGKLFVDFIIACFKLLGFMPRRKAGARERETNLSYRDTRGGGDVVLLSHFPIHARSREFVGCALACEAKSTEGEVGSKAVGQARNLKTKVEEAYSGYLVYPIVVSRAKSGYDASGRDIAPPEVVLLNQDTLLEVCRLQKERLEKGDRLLLPVHIMAAIEELIKSEKLESSASDIRTILNNVLH